MNTRTQAEQAAYLQGILDRRAYKPANVAWLNSTVPGVCQAYVAGWNNG